MTQQNEVLDAVIEIVRTLPQAAQGVVPETNVIRDLGLDSLAVMNFVMALEDRFDISMPMDRLAEIETVRDLASAIADLKGS